MAVFSANLHLIIPLAAAGFFMAVVGYVCIEEALRKN
jgi:hypothetical protein